jgi:TolB-like protein/Tfp pilus assembly protein PilF
MPILAELRKRRVFQVAVGYLAAAWLLVQVTATILPAFDLPVWALRFVVLLFALGFPIALLMAWSLQLTPDGVRLDVSSASGKGMLVFAGILVALALGWFFRGFAFPAQSQHVAQVAAADPGPAPPQPKVDARSIAVLPLVNASKDPDQQFFSDGLSENLINSLSRYAGLKVIGRISAFQFRDSKEDSATIGRKLGVSYLLGGSVQHAGDIVRINASLIRAADGTTLWSDHYDRPYKNLFALQDEIALAVATALRVKLLSPGAAANQGDRPPSGNIEAYNAYLRGLKYWRDENFLKAAEYMDSATQLDPGYAIAWAQLSGSLSTVATFQTADPEVAGQQMRKARFAADKALQLAPGLGPAHAALAYIQFYTFDPRDAVDECRRAVQLSPDDSTVLNGCAYTLMGIGKLDDAIRLRASLLSIEPLYIINYQQYGRLLAATDRLDEADKYLRTAASLPQANEAWNRATIYQQMLIALLRGDAKSAMEFATQASAKDRNAYTTLAAQAGPDPAAADAALASLLDDKAFTDSEGYWVARVYALRNDTNHAMEWLERVPVSDYLFMLSDPLILRMRNEPRFIALCKKAGLPAPGESEALSFDQIQRAESRRTGSGSLTGADN